MFYTIYQITNNVNGKIYIGKHQTKDLNDGYMGSGKHLRYAIEKYGIENFTKEILFMLESETQMNNKEAELVTEDFCRREDTYNLCPGGQGGFGYINSNNIPRMHGKKQSEFQKTIARETRIRYNKSAEGRISAAKAQKGKVGTFTGKNHTEETKNKMRKSKNRGKENSQFGTMWITDGFSNKKIRKEEAIPEGWQKGRKLK